MDELYVGPDDVLWYDDYDSELEEYLDSDLEVWDQQENYEGDDADHRSIYPH